MKTLVVYEEKEALGSVILGLTTDANRTRFNDMVKVLEAHDIKVERCDGLGNDKGYSKFPVMELDGAVLVSGRYPQVFEVANWFGIEKDAFADVSKSSLFVEANKAYGGPCCGINADTYLDPNEE